MNFENLRKLGHYLSEHQEYISQHFSMSSYLSGGTRLDDIVNHDGESADPIGWGALSGVPALASYPDESWGEYILRVYEVNSPAMSFLFHQDWPSDLDEFLGRLNYYLKYQSVPAEFYTKKFRFSCKE